MVDAITDLEDLRAKVEPVMEAVQTWIDACEAVRHAGIMEHGKCARAEAAARGEMQAAAMLVVAQSRVEALRAAHKAKYWLEDCDGTCGMQDVIAAAEALVAEVERLKARGRD